MHSSVSLRGPPARSTRGRRDRMGRARLRPHGRRVRGGTVPLDGRSGRPRRPAPAGGAEAGESLLRVASLIQDAFVAATASESLLTARGPVARAAVEPRPQRELGASSASTPPASRCSTSELVERGLLTRTRGAGDQRVRRPAADGVGTRDRATHRARTWLPGRRCRRRSTSASCARCCACSSASSGGIERPADSLAGRRGVALSSVDRHAGR